MSIAGAIAQWRAVTVAVPIAEHLDGSWRLSLEKWFVQPFGLTHTWLWSGLVLLVGAGLLFTRRREAVVLVSASVVALIFLLWSNRSMWTVHHGTTTMYFTQEEPGLASMLWTLEGLVTGLVLVAGGVISSLARSKERPAPA